MKFCVITTLTLLALCGCQIRPDGQSSASATTGAHISVVDYVGSDPQLMTSHSRDWSFVKKAVGDKARRVDLFTELLTTDRYRDEYEKLSRNERMMWPSYAAWRMNAAFAALAVGDPRLDGVVVRFVFPAFDREHPPSEDEQVAAGALWLFGKAVQVTKIVRDSTSLTTQVRTGTVPLSGGDYEIVFTLRDFRGAPVWLPESCRLTAIE